jgi:hypothetical protein
MARDGHGIRDAPAASAARSEKRGPGVAVEQHAEERRPVDPKRGDGGERVTFRLAAFGAVLVVVLFAGYGLGRLNNSAPPAATPAVDQMAGMSMGEGEPHVHNADGTVTSNTVAQSAGSVVGGLSLSSGGLTLVPLTTTFAAGRTQRLSFRVAAAGGVPVTTFTVVHDKLLHLIVVRRDLTGYQHLHPTMSPDGTWSIDLTLAAPGMYRMIADFTAVVGGRPVAATLGSDLTVAGDYTPASLPAPARSVRTGEYTVGFAGTPDTRSVQPILISVTGPDGRPAALQPYLGAFGHLVVIRQGDLGYVHVHPETQLVDGKVKFWLAAPSQGTYRMFFDFQVAGQVHTAAWTVEVS